MPVEDLFPGGEAPLEIPARSMEDGKRYPVNDVFADYYLRSHAEYLDSAFRRLYQNSRTFQAMFETRKDMKTERISVSDFVPYARAFNIETGGKNPENAIIKSDHAGLLSLWMTAYKCRELQQANATVKPGQTHPFDISSALALNRALYADCSAFAATCLFEAMRETHFAKSKIPGFLDGTHHQWTLEAVAKTSFDNIGFLYSGEASSAGFTACLSEGNKTVIREVDQAFLRAAQAEKIKKHEPKKCFSEATLRSCFEALKTMPYLSGSGEPVERDYLKGTDFSDLERLKHTGIANRLSMLRHILPF